MVLDAMRPTAAAILHASSPSSRPSPPSSSKERLAEFLSFNFDVQVSSARTHTLSLLPLRSSFFSSTSAVPTTLLRLSLLETSQSSSRSKRASQDLYRNRIVVELFDVSLLHNAARTRVNGSAREGIFASQEGRSRASVATDARKVRDGGSGQRAACSRHATRGVAPLFFLSFCLRLTLPPHSCGLLASSPSLRPALQHASAQSPHHPRRRPPSIALAPNHHHHYRSYVFLPHSPADRRPGHQG